MLHLMMRALHVMDVLRMRCDLFWRLCAILFGCVPEGREVRTPTDRRACGWVGRSGTEGGALRRVAARLWMGG